MQIYLQSIKLLLYISVKRFYCKITRNSDYANIFPVIVLDSDIV